MKEPQLERKPAIDNPWEDLVVSILSVNQFSLERTYRCLAILAQASPPRLGSKKRKGGTYCLSSLELPAFRIVCAALKIRAAD
jgi:hypothetical protein